jgi:hypothetical protein
MSFEVTVTPTVYNVEVEVNPSVQPFDVQVITQQDLADLVDEAKQYAEDAEDSADSASASASSASASASASASSANSASASASSASGSANTATTQAGIATTQAGIATTQAVIATTKAQEASQSASDALASEQASAQSASDALQSEQNALASEQASALSEANALVSEQSASASASTATAQAGIATTQAGIATAAAASIVPVTIGTPANGLSIDSNQVLSIGLASGSTNGALSSTDWSTFNAKQPAIGYTPENVANKAINLTSPDDTKYPTTLAVSTALAGKQDVLTNPITGTGTSGQVAFWSGTGTQTGDSGLFWDNTNKRLGIGTNVPTSILDIQPASGSPRVRFARVGGTELAIDTSILALGALIRTTNASPLTLGVNSSTTIFINTSFNVGIETTSPTARLDVNGTGRIRNGVSLADISGNVQIGTLTNAGFRLDVNGTTRLNGLSTIQGTTASDSGQLGTELLTTGTGDASWTGSSFATGYTHVAGSTTTLTSTLAGVVNTFYQITYTVTGRTAGSFTIAFGGFISGNLTATGAVGPQATTTGTLVITPTSDFNGTIVLSIRVISVSSASVSFISSSGTVTNQIRISSNNSNTFVGVNSGRNNTTGDNNVFFGLSTGQNNTTGLSNSFFGVNAGANNTIGNFNSFFGRGAGLANISGINNSFFGLNSGANNSIGSSNSFFGVSAGFNNTTGINNSFVGQSAGFNNTTGTDNSFVGLNAGFNNTTGTNNSFVGRNAGQNNTTGNNNSFVGTSAGFNNTTGANNSFIGVNAGRFLANGSTSLTIANNSVFLGVDSRANADNQTNQIVIGHTAIGAGSNTATLGNTSIVDTVLRGRINLQQYATGSRPAYVKGALIYDSTLSKLVVGGATDWEVVTSV